jgi:hypothetical protein
MKYDIVSHARKVSLLDKSVCTLERELGRTAFAEAIRRGSDNLMCLLEEGDDPREEAFESMPRALGAYKTANEYMDTKRQLALNLLNFPRVCDAEDS